MRIFIVLLGLAGLGGFSCLSLQMLRPSSEEALALTAQSVLVEHNLTDVPIELDHLDCVVVGHFTDEQETQIRDLLASELPAGRVLFKHADNSQRTTLQAPSVPQQPLTPNDPQFIEEISREPNASQERQGRSGVSDTDLDLSAAPATPETATPEHEESAQEESKLALEFEPRGGLDESFLAGQLDLNPTDFALPEFAANSSATESDIVQTESGSSQETTPEQVLNEPTQSDTATTAGQLEQPFIGNVPEIYQPWLDLEAKAFDGLLDDESFTILDEPLVGSVPTIPINLEEIERNPIVELDDWGNVVSSTDETAAVARVPAENQYAGQVANRETDVAPTTELGPGETTPSKVLLTREAAVKKNETRARRFGVYMTDDPNDSIVRYVDKGSSAALAGIRVGDVIVRFAKQEITAFSDLRRAVFAFRAGDVVPVQLQRDQELLTVQVTLQASQPAPKKSTDGSEALPK